MREDLSVPARFTPPTPRSRRLGRELRSLRDSAGLKVEETAAKLHCSPSRISRIESGDIKVRPGDVMEMLVAYGHSLDSEPGRSLLSLAEGLREMGWWQRQNVLSSRYATFIAYEAEATDLRNFEPTLIPGLLQTEAYAREVNSVGRETDPETIEQLVQVRLTRQEVLRREHNPLRMHAILSEASLLVEVGEPEVLRNQLSHIVRLSKRPNITVQVLRFAAGAHLADRGNLAVLTFDGGDPPLGYVESLGGELFLESAADTNRLITIFDHLKSLAMSPAESIRFIKERASGT
ncbi:helix-turn-helix domain-containing protein [Micromonospora sp. NBC_01796]|uniref:helix-turn-helix domain-containing protein n=1 Tax=Micromonospora sp. NBC_01796 TaxID=2975987 RepID=UPI002DD805E9|nr:helix-turn-helix transcriptional regulator [Micromonospora sp. NBC_01796]WSA88021.1 helix-turn-helix domain-containing protein [Micromonospora sp. NBC_01796]